MILEHVATWSAVLVALWATWCCLSGRGRDGMLGKLIYATIALSGYALLVRNDHETGLHYNRYRYYDPKIGRFISHDPISYFGGINLYQYASKPVSWIDPLGLNRFKPKTLTTGSVFRGGSSTASSMTPRPNKDDVRKGSNAPGLSADMSVDNIGNMLNSMLKRFALVVLM
ncbi:RHS repeat-associated core domain-containing protein [Pseudomonas chlororaphis]|uniref:RHS repeat-associated core domain-containing protein n=1 Tax=Pseudomonas chlororaphis TaxID=587753 RepID=UPI00209AFE34|nr:RHS repeat-associated core domain-containing protein [Pseudomonas chlororaphis]MCO7610572.1 RHS repeat-associated core domain-containing protein [Pseudomonas chlororaphis]